ncbi:MAG: DUF262 domain-containing protein [Christensenellaceae bacterium]
MENGTVQQAELFDKLGCLAVLSSIKCIGKYKNVVYNEKCQILSHQLCLMEDTVMPDLLGIIAPLRKLLANSNETITVSFGQIDQDILVLKEDRVYRIPDFQREIRWNNDNIALLIDDMLSGPKYLGNIILTQHPNNTFSIIDGQQRITVLTMILSCIEQLHSKNIDTIHPCNLEVESFNKFSELLAACFPSEKVEDKDIIESDKLHQRTKYYDLWKFILTHKAINEQINAQKVIDNLGKSSVNIILNKSDDINDGIRYFIDVNLKGKQLDTEDIFKSYLFKNDQSADIRTAWYQLKTNVSKSTETKLSYPLLKFLEHYFYCDLYKKPSYKGMEFGEDFLLKKEFKTRDRSSKVFREGMHLIELIGSKQYMLDSLLCLNNAIDIMLKIITSTSTNDEFENLFPCIDIDGKPSKIDSTELKVIHNFMGKVLKDAKNLPKALIMKYILSTLLDKTPKPKAEYRKIYGVYLLSVLFAVFESKKSKELILGILKANNDSWYAESISQINSYFSPDRITDTRLLAQYKLTMNEDMSDYQFRCKSLATIYNFFEIKDDSVNIRKHKIAKLYQFITDSEQFTTEHFIISNSNSAKISLDAKTVQLQYSYADKFWKTHANNLFNFIFIPTSMNSSLSNYWLPHKLCQIDKTAIKCEYTLMYLEQVTTLSESIKKSISNEASIKNDLDLYFARDYKDAYVNFARNILKEVFRKIQN